MIERMNHDMGGLPAGKVERVEHDYEDWELRVDAINALCRGKIYTLDEMRKNVETLPPAAYDRMAYYEKWIAGVTQALIQRGVITSDELGRKLAEVERRYASGKAE